MTTWTFPIKGLPETNDKSTNIPPKYINCKTSITNTKLFNKNHEQHIEAQHSRRNYPCRVNDRQERIQ